MIRFLVFLTLFTLFFIFYDIKRETSTEEEIEKPLVSFYDSVLYKIDDKSVNSVIPSKEAYFYSSREEMIKGTIVLRDQEKRDGANTNSISADYIVKIGDDLYLDSNVLLESASGITLKTEQLQYNLKTKIAENEQRFVALKGFHDFYGTDLHLDLQKRDLKAQNTHFTIKVENEN